MVVVFMFRSLCDYMGISFGCKYLAMLGYAVLSCLVLSRLVSSCLVFVFILVHSAAD